MSSQTDQKHGASGLAAGLLRFWGVLLLACCFMCSGRAALAQQDDLPHPPDPRFDGRGGPPPMAGRLPPMERAFRVGPPGRWWHSPEFAKLLGLTPDQQTKMDAVFQQSRPHLIDLSAALQKEEVYMEPLLSSDQPDEGKILAQIDSIASARAELEKANARMLLGLRRILTQEQWKKMQADEPMMHAHGDPSPTRRSAAPQ